MRRRDLRSEGLATRSGGAVRVRVRVQVEVTSKGNCIFFSRGGRGAVRVRGRVRGRTAVRALLPERGGAVRVGVQVRMGAVRVRVRPTPTPFFHMHRLFGFILSLLISNIETCAYVLLSWNALRGEALRPCSALPPAPPHPLLFLTGSPCYLLLRLFLKCIVYLASSYLY